MSSANNNPRTAQSQRQSSYQRRGSLPNREADSRRRDPGQNSRRSGHSKKSRTARHKDHRALQNDNATTARESRHEQPPTKHEGRERTPTDRREASHPTQPGGTEERRQHPEWPPRSNGEAQSRKRRCQPPGSTTASTLQGKGHAQLSLIRVASPDPNPRDRALWHRRLDAPQPPPHPP